MYIVILVSVAVLGFAAWLLDIRVGRCTCCNALAIKHRYTTENTSGSRGLAIAESEYCLTAFGHPKQPDKIID